MHTINLSKYSLRTDLIIDDNKNKEYKHIKEKVDNIEVEENISQDNRDYYTTILFDDVTDKDNFQKVLAIFIDKLKPYIAKLSLKEEENVLIVGLGNAESTPDSLGPKAIKQILVTKYLYDLGEVEVGYHKTSAMAPSVTSITGIETAKIIKSLVNTTEAKLLIVIDSLASSSINRLNKTIQITNTGIHPGSGVGNNRKELSEKSLGVPVIAIGVPTVVDASTIVFDTINFLKQQISYKLSNQNSIKNKLVPERNQDYRQETKKLPLNLEKDLLGEVGILTDEQFKELIAEVLAPINYNLMVTPTEIDFIIEKLAILIATGINKSLHKNLTSTKNTN